MHWRMKRRFGVLFALAATLVGTFVPSEGNAGDPGKERAHVQMAWYPQGNDLNHGGEYQSNVPSSQVSCTANTQGMLVKTMWVPHTNMTGDWWVEHGWFKGLAYSGTCYNSGRFYYGWIDKSTGRYRETVYSAGGSLTVGAWNTFRLVYSGYYGGNHYYRLRINGTLIADVIGGAPVDLSMNVGFETDQASNCIDARTDVKEIKKYKQTDNTWGYPENGTFQSGGNFFWNMDDPTWIAPFKSFYFSPNCGGGTPV